MTSPRNRVEVSSCDYRLSISSRTELMVSVHHANLMFMRLSV
jgi:hypothetical protein